MGLRLRHKRDTLTNAALIISHLAQTKNPKSAQSYLDAWTKEPDKTPAKPVKPTEAFKRETKESRDKKFNAIWAQVEKQRAREQAKSKQK